MSFVFAFILLHVTSIIQRYKNSLKTLFLIAAYYSLIRVYHNSLWGLEFSLGLDHSLAAARGRQLLLTTLLPHPNPSHQDAAAVWRNIPSERGSPEGPGRGQSSVSTERKEFPLCGGFLPVSGSGRHIWFGLRCTTRPLPMGCLGSRSPQLRPSS